MSIGIVTRGMITPFFQENEITSCDRPQLKEVLEVRPKTRSVSLEPTLHPVCLEEEDE